LSAPPKFGGKSISANKQINQPSARIDDGEKVHIPNNFDDSDFDSETLSDRIRQLEGYGDLGQGPNKVKVMVIIKSRVWMGNLLRYLSINYASNIETLDKSTPLMSVIDISDEGILNSQEGVSSESGKAD